MSWIITGSQRYQPDALLDQFPGAAAAYSLRNLVGTSNPAVVRVRRDNDDAEQDFTAAEVSDGTLATWVGAGNSGFVRTWYDQSGNGFHAQQATTTAQPQILLSDTNSKPTISFDGSNDFLLASAAIYNQLTIFGVQRFRSTGTKIAFGYGDYRADMQLGLWQIQSGPVTVGSYTQNTNYALRVLSRESGNSKAFNNSVQSGSTVTTALTQSTTTTLAFGNRVDLAVYTDVNFSELILYPSIASDATRVGIEANINAHYSIYP